MDYLCDMERVASGKIRRLQWGIVPTLPSKVIQVGSKGPNDMYVVCEIQEDKNTFYDLGYIEYLIYIKKVRGTDDAPVLWQRFSKVPDSVEYALDGVDEVLI